jgi:hypothetical protein
VTLVGSVVSDALPNAMGERGHGIHSQGEPSIVTLDRSAVVGNKVLGVLAGAPGVQLSITDSVIRGTGPGPIGQFAGVQVESQSKLTMKRSAVVGNYDMGVFIRDQSSADISDSVIRDSQPKNSNPNLPNEAGRGISMQDGSSLVLARSALIGNREYSLVLGGSGTSAKVTGTLIKDTKRSTGAKGGWGLSALDGAALDLSGSAIEDNIEYGVAVGRAGTKATISSTLIRGTYRAAGITVANEDYKVQGIGVQEGAKVTLTNSALIKNRHIGLYVWGYDAEGAPSVVDADGLVIRETLPADDVTEGNAAGVLAGPYARIFLKNAALVGNSTTGVLMTEPHAVMAVEDSVIRDTKLNNLGEFGRGVVIQLGAEATLTRVAMIANREFGLFVSEAGATCRASQILIEGTLPDQSQNTGRGIGVQLGARLVMDKSAVRRNFDIGMHVVSDASATVNDSIFTTTSKQPSDDRYGHGILVHYHSNLELSRSLIEASAAIGLAFANASATIAGTLVRKNQVGLHVLEGSTLVTESALPSKVGPTEVHVLDDTQFVDNAVRLGDGEIPLPNADKSYQK